MPLDPPVVTKRVHLDFTETGVLKGWSITWRDIDGRPVETYVGRCSPGMLAVHALSVAEAAERLQGVLPFG